MMNTRYLYNPFYLYIITFSVSLFFFSLQWSDLYPKLDMTLFMFFLVTFEFSFLFGFIYDQRLKLETFETPIKTKKIDFVYLFIIFSIIVEFIYNKGIPFFLFSDSNLEYDYKSFGIKTFHVLVFTLTSFYTLYLFQKYLNTKRSIDFIKFLSLYIYPILIMNRGSLVMISVGMIFIYIILKKKIALKNIFTLISFLILLLYIFGVLGNIRENDSNYMINISEPSTQFINLNVPSEFMWSYIYVSSPIATLQLNVNVENNSNLDTFILSSILPDFISKHFLDDPIKIVQITNWLTVGTIYSKAYYSFGWIGMWIIFFLMSIFSFIYLHFLPKRSPYKLVGYSILLTIIVFSIFSNMWTFSGLSLQLIYPFILERFKLK